MPEGRPSRTAELVALTRAHLTHLGIVDDPLARGFLSPGMARVEWLLRQPGLRRLGRNRSFAWLAARTLYFDQAVTAALDAGAEQVLVLGAGFDSRAWRLARPGVAFFEVDQPETQAVKRAKAPDGGPSYVGTDVTDPAVVDRLIDAGFDTKRRTVITAEGLTMYLPEEAVASLLARLAEAVPVESRLVVNFGVGFDRSSGDSGRGRKALAKAGEEIRFTPPPDSVTRLLARTGWKVDELLDGPAMATRFLTGTGLPAMALSPTSSAATATR